jgi:hypothetical protein
MPFGEGPTLMAVRMENIRGYEHDEAVPVWSVGRARRSQGSCWETLTLYHDHALAQRVGNNARQAALAFDRRRQVRVYYDLFPRLTGTSPSHS